MWVGGVQRHARWIVLLGVLLLLALTRYTATHLSVDTDTSNMLSADLPWRKAELQLKKSFPALYGQLVVVLDGATPELADAAQFRLTEALRAQPDLFPEVFAAEVEPYFRRNGLLFLDREPLQKISGDLNRAQPFLGALSREASLRSLSMLLLRALEAPPEMSVDLSPALNKFAEGIGAAADGRFYQLSWQDLMGNAPASSSAKRRFITLSPQLDYSQLLPATVPIERLHELARDLKLDSEHGVTVRLTGTVALEHEELLTAFKGAGLALGGALLLVALLLVLALRSLRLVIAAVATLVFGLIGTAAFAAVAVGHLNLISVAFGVLYVGLGIDYALYLCMQYRELVGQGMPTREALPHAAADVGGFMMVCAATTSLGFFAFIPTDFTGIAELGLISGAGMFISLILSLTLLPALIALLPPDPARVRLNPVGSGPLGRMLDWPYAHARRIWIGAAVLAVTASVLAPRAHFDYDPLNLRDPKSESVTTFRELLRDPNIPALSLSALAPDAAQAMALSQHLGGLPRVARTLNLQSFVPQDQAAKLALLDDLSLNLALSAPQPVNAAPDQELQALAALRTALPAYAQRIGGAQGEAARALAQQLERFEQGLQTQDAATQAARVAALRESLLGALSMQLQGLQMALAAEPVTERDLPPALVQRWRSADGQYRVEVWPKEVLDNPAAMERFIADVRTVAPAAAGPPVAFVESGQAVVKAFRYAFVSSLVAITVLLLILLRSVMDTLIVLIPLTLAGLLTVALLVICRIPFNFANVIALPLILGVGVDYGVYLVQRGRAAASAQINLLQTSTARAVLFGALITMANFVNLMLTPHPGMVSMGVLLTVGLGMTLLCALVLLPSLLVRRYRDIEASP
jgi:hypothetical protein